MFRYNPGSTKISRSDIVPIRLVGGTLTCLSVELEPFFPQEPSSSSLRYCSCVPHSLLVARNLHYLVHVREEGRVCKNCVEGRINVRI
jgi:hypothetical protein